ncbi:hypothetical protein G6F59_018223 [Rhizopus arrhizus]|nr:hypothetical protein G6F59_018223 [Rhizopus arrhizus]
MVHAIGARDQQALRHDGKHRHDQRHQHKRRPVVHAQVVQQHPGQERARRVLRAMGEVDDVQQAENHRQADREQGVERTVDQAKQQLAEQRRGRHSENFEHRHSPLRRPGGARSGQDRGALHPPTAGRPRSHAP